MSNSQPMGRGKETKWSLLLNIHAPHSDTAQPDISPICRPEKAFPNLPHSTKPSASMDTLEPHSCHSCRDRFLLYDDSRSEYRFPFGNWRIWDGGKAPITIGDLEHLAAGGCLFADYILNKLQTNKTPSVNLDELQVVRYTPAKYEDYSDSLIVGLPGEYPSWAKLSLIAKPDCANPISGFMPTRILEIDDAAQALILREQPSVAPYAALSYCCGNSCGAHAIALSRETLERSDGEVRLENAALPHSIKDAVEVVSRALGLRYLWVDALCIIKGDRDDVAREEGFLHPRFPLGAKASSVAFELPYRYKDGAVCTVIATDEDVSVGYSNPLSGRAWGFQEFVLSPRVLAYDQMGAMWFCREQQVKTDGFDCGLDATWCRPRLKELANTTETNVLSPTELGSRSHNRAEFCYEIWNTLVQVFMMGALAYLEDRLPSLAGIALRMASHTGAFVVLVFHP
ncbi:hypothetical protein BX600DRAFT_532940 [Xylariales sp. PMI_506]|nr:hypothetical protein BX600DRAFT_532940 [Xylariales sp. PMI_506]